MLTESITFLLSHYFIVIPLVGLIAAGISLWHRNRGHDPAVVFEALLSFYCSCAIGLNYLCNFVMHVFFAKMAADFIGWPNSPFQYEVGFASLGFGVVGLLAFRRDFGLRLAAVTGPAFFLWGAAGGHLYQIIAHHNFSPGNAGAVFWTDLFLPAWGFVLLAGWRKTNL